MVYICICVHAKSFQSCLTLCDCMGCSPPGSSAHGVLQARILEWVAVPFSRGSSQPRDRTHVCLHFSALVGRFFTTSTTWEAPYVCVCVCVCVCVYDHVFIIYWWALRLPLHIFLSLKYSWFTMLCYFYGCSVQWFKYTYVLFQILFPFR